MNKKILFVDGDPSALELCRQILRDEFEIATAVSGEEGLLVLGNDDPYATVIAEHVSVDRRRLASSLLPAGDAGSRGKVFGFWLRIA